MSRPNIIWITLDSVRNDHTTMDGYKRDTTPRLNEIATRPQGQGYTECISHSTWTLASSAAILTGTYPSHNTVGVGGESIPAEITTVPELFSEAGYLTACLSRNSHISTATDMDRGFDRFEWIAASTLLQAAGPRTLIKYLLNIREHSAGFTPDTAKHATPFVMNDVAKRWLDDFKTENSPFFFYLHYNEPHRPYYPPLPYLDRFTGDLPITAAEAGELSMDIHYNLYKRIANGCDLSDIEWQSLRAMYDAELVYTDKCIGRLFDYVKSIDIGETVFIVTADHGELFGEHGLLAHKLVLDDALVNVPLVIHGADFDIDSDETIQHIDVLQTLLDRAGGDTSQFQGVNLDETTREFAVAQRGPADFEPFLEHNPEFDTSKFHSPMLTCLRTPEFKFQQSEERSELFHLPDEESDISEKYPEKHDELKSKLDDWMDEYGEPISDAREGEFSDAMRQQLADLGYVE